MNIGARQQSRGFTLIEIIVALAIFGLIVAAIYSSWMAIARGTRTGLGAAAAVQRSRIAIRTLEEALTSARAFAADIQYYGFVGEGGDSATLSFVSRLPPTFPRSGRFGDCDVRRVTFSLDPGPDYTKQLVLRQTPLLMEVDVDEREHPVVLAKNVKGFQVQFWSKGSSGWEDEWTQTNQLPQMVKITLQLGGNDPTAVKAQEEITRVVALPSVVVQAGWQAPAIPRGPTDGGLDGSIIKKPGQ